MDEATACSPKALDSDIPPGYIPPYLGTYLLWITTLSPRQNRGPWLKWDVRSLPRWGSPVRNAWWSRYKILSGGVFVAPDGLLVRAFYSLTLFISCACYLRLFILVIYSLINTAYEFVNVFMCNAKNPPEIASQIERGWWRFLSIRKDSRQLFIYFHSTGWLCVLVLSLL